MSGRTINVRAILIAAIAAAIFVAAGWAFLGPGLFLQSALSAFTMGSQYALIAVGYSMVYGIVRLINFAHGDVLMIGVYVAHYLILFLHVPWWAAMVLSMVVTGLAGAAIERIAYRPLRQASRASLLITAIAVSLILENMANIAFGAHNQAFSARSGLTAGRYFEAFGETVYYQNLLFVVPAITLVALVGLYVFIERTKLGAAIRATAQDVEMARMLGIPVDRMITLVFFIGSALAAAAGVMYSLQYVQIHPLMGIMPGIKAFTAAVIGGIGSIPGAVLGGLLLGFAETFAVAFFPALTSFQQVFAVVVLLAVLLIRPTGIVGEDLTEKV